jgi:two-component system chemotaxis sensor kinase CheA
MPLSDKLREHLISGFRAELAEHIQTMTDGLLALEQHRIADDQRQPTLENIFRAAHSLKGAARAIGVSAIEQLAHALEEPLDAMQHDAIEPTPELFTACYRALDAIRAAQAAYESGEITPPAQVSQAMAILEPFCRKPKASKPEPERQGDTAPTPVIEANLQPQTPASVLQSSPMDETVRVSVSKLDALMTQLNELLVAKIRAEQHLVRLRQTQEYMSQWQKEWLSVRSAYGQLVRKTQSRNNDSPYPAPPSLAESGNGSQDLARLISYVGASQERLHAASESVNELSREYNDDTMHMSLVIDALEEEIKRVRMLPLSTITGPLGRMVRDLAQAAGKEAVLEIKGAEVELDKRVLERINDPLIHLLRNAIDHGIEMPEQRAAAGKPRSGTVMLEAEQLGKDVVICVSDDGRGLDLEAIRQTAVHHSSPTGDVQELSQAELVALIFEAGFSTNPIITNVSGRGVGLNVVRRNVEALNGRIGVDWTPGVGATFTLTLPLTLTSSRGLLVRVSDELFAIPLNAIERILRVNPEQIFSLAGHDALHYNNRILIVVRLDDVLGLPHAETNGNDQDDEHIPIVILAAADRLMAFTVSELVGEQEIVIKGLGKQLARVGGLAGASVMGSGDVILILNAADLIKLALRGERRSVFEAATETPVVAASPPRRQVLIVDDSITTRTLEKNILEAAGYSVQLALDGQEALNLIASGGVPDLIISDVAMPKLDGFGLTQKLKADARTANVPVILVTSLDSLEDKTRGIEVGADAYIVKSGFDQSNLLDTIEQLI